MSNFFDKKNWRRLRNPSHPSGGEQLKVNGKALFNYMILIKVANICILLFVLYQL